MPDRLRARFAAWRYRWELQRRSGELAEFEALLLASLAAVGLAIAVMAIAGVRFDWWE